MGIEWLGWWEAVRKWEGSSGLTEVPEGGGGPFQSALFLLLDLPAGCCGDGRRPLHGAGHGGAQ